MDNEPAFGFPNFVARAMLITLFSLSLLAPYPASAVTGVQADADGSEPTVYDSSANEQTTIDFVHRKLSEGVAATAGWMDAFFDDPNYRDEENQTSLRLSLSSFMEEGEDLDFGANVRLRLSLPRWENRLQLIISGDDDSSETAEWAEYGGLGDLAKEDEKSSSLGVRYYAEQTERHNVSLGGGIRSSDGNVNIYIQPRYRYFRDLGTWDIRFIQKVGWFEPDGFDSRSTLQLERLFDDEYFFRTSAQVNWYEDDDGLFPELNFTLRRALSKNRVLALEWNNYFETEPSDVLESSVVKTRYRQRLYRDWLWFEAAPQVTFPREEDYEAKLGVMFRLQAYFGLNHLKPLIAPGK